MTAAMAMPETPVEEHHGTVFGKHDIGFAGKTAVIDPETQTLPEKETADTQFLFGVFPFDGGHHPAARFRGEYIAQRFKPAIAAPIVGESSIFTSTAYLPNPNSRYCLR